MATRASIYSFQNNIIEIAISIDPIGELHLANEPLTKAERIKFGLLDGDNPWRHLGVPDFVLENKEDQRTIETVDNTELKQVSSSSNNLIKDVEVNRKRSLSTASISTDDINFEMEEFSKAWANAEDGLQLEVINNCLISLSRRFALHIPTAHRHRIQL